MSNEAQHAVEQILGLRALTLETGTITTRTQGQILRALPDDVLLEVAPVLKHHFDLEKALSGKVVAK